MAAGNAGGPEPNASSRKAPGAFTGKSGLFEGGSCDFSGGGDGFEGAVGARVIREIIRTPAFLEIIKARLASLDPESARLAVHTILWEDPALGLSLASVAPQAVNCLIEAVLELGRTLDNFGPDLLDAFVDRLSGSIDARAASSIPAVYGPVLEKIEFAQRARTAVGLGINTVAMMVNRAAENNPYFIRDSLSRVDGREVARAAMAVGKSVALWVCSGLKKALTSVMGYAGRGDLS